MSDAVFATDDALDASRNASGLGTRSLARLLAVFERTPGLERVWMFGSRARGDHRADSDLDLAVEMPDSDEAAFTRLRAAVEGLDLIQRIDIARLDEHLEPGFRTRIERDRKPFWQPRRHAAEVAGIGSISLKKFQSETLDVLGTYLAELDKQRELADKTAQALRVAELDLPDELIDFPKKAWESLRKAQRLPADFADRPYNSRFDGAGRPIPNLCLKLPTGGGKTLLAAASVARVFSGYLRRHTGLVLWVVPNEAIYRQTYKALSDRDHPYRQMLNVAAAGRVKILDKTSPLKRVDVESHLCVMVLMLQSAARRSKETLRFFRDRGNVLGFVPREDDIAAHWNILAQAPNLDVYAPFGASDELARKQQGSIVKSSLGNAMRLLRPMVVIDEGHHAYTENALKTLDGFNPCLMLELSATPRVSSDKNSGSNILVDVRGTALDEAEMIKLPIHVEVRRWNDWQSCLAAAVRQLDELQREADALHAESARYIRPILLVQVERTGADLRDAGLIHADDARAYLMQLGLSEKQIALKTSEKNELGQPENLDLLAPACEVRAIVTKQALQEGWDCPFAYVLCALAAGRNPAAMTQLVGRILRQPQVAKTGRAALDACYVLCHDARTADVVKGIKQSLESEGMGDLTLNVHGDAGAPGAPRKITMRRRPAFARLKLFVPRVTWVEADGTRRELVYDSDILAHLDWHAFDPGHLAQQWAPNTERKTTSRFDIDLSILDRPLSASEPSAAAEPLPLDRARLVRALLDLAPNAWLVWSWLDTALTRLVALGFSEAELASASASLTERLRVDVEAERDRLAQTLFNRLVAEGRIEFRLRADATDYELPHEVEIDLNTPPQALLQHDGLHPVEKSLLEPALRLPDMNALEAGFAGYLDAKEALTWWHRNVAKTQFGLQGWRRHKVYPDFVFGQLTHDGRSRTVLMETKGLHLQGSDDTAYKQALLQRLSEAFRDERRHKAGELVLEGPADEEVRCDLIIDQAWRGALEARWFAKVG
jgi:type III restriction enzyme